MIDTYLRAECERKNEFRTLVLGTRIRFRTRTLVISPALGRYIFRILYLPSKGDESDVKKSAHSGLNEMEYYGSNRQSIASHRFCTYRIVPTREPSRFALGLGAKCLAAFAVGGLPIAAKPCKKKEERLLKNEVQKPKKQYKRIGTRKEVLFKDDEWEIVKSNAEKMNLSTTKYIVKKSLEGNLVQNSISDIADLNRQLSAIGNNLNQLARKANTINNIYAEDYERMRREYAQLCLTLSRRISTLRRTAA